MTKPVKVLLVSPKDPQRPGDLKLLVGGENTFTQGLLENPPSGVEYRHYFQALKRKEISNSNWQKLPSLLMKTRILPLDVGFLSFEVREKFDLVHCHTYCLKLENYHGPVVMSDSSSNYLFLKDYLGWSQTRINFSYALRGQVVKRLNFYDPNLNFQNAQRLVVWSHFARKIHLKLGCPEQKIVVIPPGVAKLPGKKIKHQGFNLLFVGVWFERKGGPLVLEAYKVLRKRHPEINLTLIGQVPREGRLPKDTWQEDYLPRERLIREVFPQADVLVLVPPLAEGYGLVVLEAASLGVPAIVSRVWALPEIVKDQETGFVIPPGDLAALVNRLEILIENRSWLAKMGRAAKKRFLEKFWIKVTNRKLLKVYQEAIKN